MIVLSQGKRPMHLAQEPMAVPKAKKVLFAIGCLIKLILTDRSFIQRTFAEHLLMCQGLGQEL